MNDRIGRFRVVRTLGEGGMGVVYAARDEGLGREVALKMVRTASDPANRGRLLREARLAASVNHPNVCQVYEVGEHEGSVYVAMELLEGEPLSARIARSPLPLTEACAVALGVLDALHALHGKGVVHRDLKPSNVFLTPHGVKLLDLGLALPLDEEARRDSRLTQTGAIVGTPGYMPPEQWTGEALGPPADVFGMGALLFEMLAGRPAYAGGNLLEVYHAIVHQPPPSLVGGPAVLALDRLIQRALSARPEDRPVSAAAMAEEVRAALRLSDGNDAARARDVRRVIVLPFRLLRPDPEVDYLRLGLADAIASSLASVDSIVVRSSQVAARFASGSVDLAHVAREAQVDLVLSGTVLRAHDRVRVTLELAAAAGGTVVRAETVTASADDVFGLQDECARRVASALAGASAGAPASPGSGPLQREVPADPEAYELYLRANAIAINSAMLQQAQHLYEAALAKDPRYAPAWARLGRVHRVMAKFGHGDPGENLRSAERALRRALDLAPDLAIAHNLWTNFEVEEGHADRSLARLLDRARAHGDDPDLFAGLVLATRFGGLLDASVAADGRARRIDPGARTSVAYTHWVRGDLERALRYDDDDARYVHQYALPLLGRAEEAADLCRSVMARASSDVVRVLIGGTLGALEGDRAAVLRALEEVEHSSFHDPEGLFLAARNAARVGASREALALLDRVVAGGYFVPQVLRSDPWLRSLRDEPAFPPLLARAEDGRRRALAIYREHGGDALLGPES